MNFKISNWYRKNTPLIMQKIGDIGLVIAFINTNFLSFNSYLGINLDAHPHLRMANEICLALGVLIKIISKFAGQTNYTNAQLESELTEVKEGSQFIADLYKNKNG